MKKKNIDILEHIQMYCEDIKAAQERFGKDRSVFDIDRDYRNSVCMSLLQIGELTGRFRCFASWNRRSRRYRKMI